MATTAETATTELQKQLAFSRSQLENLKKEIDIVKQTKLDRNLFDTVRGRLGAASAASQQLSRQPSIVKDGKNEVNEERGGTGGGLGGELRLYNILCEIRSRRVLRGHFGKVYAVHWSGDNVHLVSASQDGKLMIWNGLTTNKLQSIPLASSWVITCAFEQINNNYVACGGMDNICSLYKVNHHEGNSSENKVIRVAQELIGHQGYLSSCCFIDQNNMLTASGDATCHLWDIERGRPIRVFRDHTADVMSVSSSKVDSNIFASGSCDATAKVWDIRTPNKSTITFRGHSSDVNSVSFFPDGFGIGTGSDDRSCKFFDMRSMVSLASFGNESIAAGISSVAFSKSGRLLFAGYEDFTLRGWDIFADPSGSTACLVHLTGHENRVSNISINPCGDALLSGSWDTTLRVWA